MQNATHNLSLREIKHNKTNRLNTKYLLFSAKEILCIFA